MSFRTRVLLVVIVVSVVPLGLLGLWLTRSAARSGEQLLRSRLDQSLDDTSRRLGTAWLRQRSDLLSLAEDEAVGASLMRGDGARPDDAAPPSLRRAFDAQDASVRRVVVRDGEGRDLWTLARPPERTVSGTAIDRPTVSVHFPIHRKLSPERLGSLEASLTVGDLLGQAGFAPTVTGMVLAAFGAGGGPALSAVAFDPDLLRRDRFEWGGDIWLARRRSVAQPPLELVVAAPLTTFSRPFDEAAGTGALLVAAVAVAGLFVTLVVTGRMTRSLEDLAAAAEAVSEGDLERRVEHAGPGEVVRVARAFNAMTDSLRETLRELSQRERLAAVGEFAASLAHEVRNPLTSIRVDLQTVEEGLPEDSPLREPQGQALEEIVRLDQTVAEALRVARTGRSTSARVDLRRPIEAAIRASEPAFEHRGATLSSVDIPDQPIEMTGDEGAIEQLLLNLLLNAAEALGPGGTARIEATSADGDVVVSIVDTGTGIAPEIQDRIFEPLFSSRPDGTGLGLTIARRIAEAHGGHMEIQSEVGSGTTVRVVLPAGRPDRL